MGRVLKPGGRFLFNPYADSHSSYRAGREGPDGLTLDISAGSLVGVGQIRFISRRGIDDLLADGWCLKSITRLELADLLDPHGDVHAEWRVVAEGTTD